MTDYIGLSDAELISMCLKQDAGAWEALIQRYHRLITSITFKFALTAEDAADIYQLVCMRLYQQMAGLRKQEKLSSWVITVTVRECWKLKKHPLLTNSLDAQAEAVGFELADERTVPFDESLVLIEKQHQIRRAMELLPENCRRMLEMLFFEDEPASYTEISQRLGTPVPSIGPTRARCLEKMKQSLKTVGFLR